MLFARNLFARMANFPALAVRTRHLSVGEFRFNEGAGLYLTGLAYGCRRYRSPRSDQRVAR